MESNSCVQLHDRAKMESQKQKRAASETLEGEKSLSPSELHDARRRRHRLLLLEVFFVKGRHAPLQQVLSQSFRKHTCWEIAEVLIYCQT